MIKDNHLVRQVALIILLLWFLNARSQTNGDTKYPQGYFLNPLRVPIALSANFGELRPGHWHMGLDIRTEQKENLAVLAAADGYIAHIGVRPLSFGRFIIINHPNGYSTLYAHLNEFYPALENYVRKTQKEKESWAIDLDFAATEFKVKKGQEIAKSGNTGGSQGPHLHYEIRNTKTGRSLNPQLFGYNIKDDVRPTISRLSVYDRGISTYLQTPQMIGVIKTDSGYYTKPRKIVTGNKKISFAITATDKITGSSGPNGIYGAKLYFDSAPQVEFVIDNMDYDETDYINAHIDKKLRNAGGPFVQHVSLLPGFRGNIYDEIGGNGVIELPDTASHQVRIDVFDTEDNISSLYFEVQYNETMAGRINRPAIGRQLIPNQVNIVEEKEFELYMPDNCLYDSIPFSYSQQNSFSPTAITALHLFGNPIYPMHSAFSLRLKTVKPVSNELKNKIMVLKEWKGARAIRKGEWQNGWITSSFDNLGNFQAFIDTVPPIINAPAKGKDTLDLSPLSRIAFTPSDNFGVRSFHAELDGQWLMFTNDKGRTHIYNFDEQVPYGVHELKVRVEDIVGNVTEKTWWFKRYPYTPPKKKVYKKKKSAKKKTVTKKKR